MDEQVIQGMRSKYPGIHPLIFHRSLRRSKTMGDLFDILESAAEENLPMKWDTDKHKWVHVEDLLQVENFFEEE